MGWLLDEIGVPEHGSLANAMAIQRGLDYFPEPVWAFMAHNDSAPLAPHWDDAFFDFLGDGKVVGNIRDKTRVQAAHSSGTLFHQQMFLARNGSVWPVIKGERIEIDVGDGISLCLHDAKSGLVPVLPNTLQDASLLDGIAQTLPELEPFMRTGTHVSLSAAGKPVFGHLGRGTPRSEGSNMYSGRPAVELWADIVRARFVRGEQESK